MVFPKAEGLTIRYHQYIPRECSIPHLLHSELVHQSTADAGKSCTCIAVSAGMYIGGERPEGGGHTMAKVTVTAVSATVLVRLFTAAREYG